MRCARSGAPCATARPKAERSRTSALVRPVLQPELRPELARVDPPPRRVAIVMFDRARPPRRVRQRRFTADAARLVIGFGARLHGASFSFRRNNMAGDQAFPHARKNSRQTLARRAEDALWPQPPPRWRARGRRGPPGALAKAEAREARWPGAERARPARQGAEANVPARPHDKVRPLAEPARPELARSSRAPHGAAAAARRPSRYRRTRSRPARSLRPRPGRPRRGCR